MVYNPQTQRTLRSTGLSEEQRGLLTAFEGVSDPTPSQRGQMDYLRMAARSTADQQRIGMVIDRWNEKRDADRQAVRDAGKQPDDDSPRFLR